MATENNPVEITTIEDAMAEINKLQAELAKEKKRQSFIVTYGIKRSSVLKNLPALSNW